MDSNRELTYRRKVMTAFNMGAVAAACVLIAASASYIFVRVTRPLNELKNRWRRSAGEIWTRMLRRAPGKIQ